MTVLLSMWWGHSFFTFLVTEFPFTEYSQVPGKYNDGCQLWFPREPLDRLCQGPGHRAVPCKLLQPLLGAGWPRRHVAPLAHTALPLGAGEGREAPGPLLTDLLRHGSLFSHGCWHLHGFQSKRVPANGIVSTPTYIPPQAFALLFTS